MADSAVSPPRRGIQSRLIRVFAIQATLVSLATALGVYAAYKIAEDVLVREALTGEAEHYWSLVDEFGDFPLPNTSNMLGYRASLEDLSSLPEPLQSLEPGYGRQHLHDKTPLVLVTEHAGERLYLVFKEEQVSRLALFFGVAPLTAVLILIYLASWFTFRQSQRVISPVVRLAEVVEAARVPDRETLATDLRPFHRIDADIDTLATSIEHFSSRIQSLVERERAFTRDASHELRTPLAVIKGSMDVLQQQEQFTAQGEQVIRRVRKTLQDMEGLIETLLLLAREENSPLEAESLLLNDLLPGVIAQTTRALGVPATRVHIDARCMLQLEAPNKVLTILFTNLLRNALQHGGDDTVTVVIDERMVTVRDQGPGMDEVQMARAFQPFHRGAVDGRGHGLGLTIVKRLCDRFDWPLQAHSAVGEGTSMSVRFPESRIVGRV